MSPKLVANPDICACNGISVVVENSLMTVPPNEMGAVKEQDHRGTVESDVLVTVDQREFKTIAPP